MSTAALLQVDGLHVHLSSTTRSSRRDGEAHVLAGVSLEVGAGEIVGVIGETGSGKTTLARTVAGLIRPSAGEIRLEGREISALTGRSLRFFRRSGILQLVFQDPLRSIDPDLRIGAVVAEGLDLARRGDGADRDARVARALERVGLHPGLATRRAAELSGGQRQRVAIARAIVMEPKLLLCDEPVSALDASNRNRVLRLLQRLRDELDVAVVVISHDLASIAGVVDRVAVLYHGRIVEDGPPEQVFTSPAHPYTALLVASAPRVSRAQWQFDLTYEQLRVSEPADPTGRGCIFAGRCRFASDVCRDAEPSPASVGQGWSAACHHAAEWRVKLLRAAERSAPT